MRVCAFAEDAHVVTELAEHALCFGNAFEKLCSECLISGFLRCLKQRKPLTNGSKYRCRADQFVDLVDNKRDPALDCNIGKDTEQRHQRRHGGTNRC